MKRNSTLATKTRRFALTGIAAALALALPSAHALGLGRLIVQSALGETLRAEIDITSLTAEEAADLKVRVAPPESYRAAGVDYNAVLPATEATLMRRGDGRPYLRLTSNRAVQEPFVDVILEINWASGRLVREYTLLFDPPNMARAPAPAASSAPGAVATAPVIGAAPSRPADIAPSPPRLAERRTPPSRPPATEAPGAPGGADDYRVRSGDTLSAIASRTQRPGVSLDQMLVALFRANPTAFVDNNMNRLRSGVVLSVPGADSVQSVPAPEARRIIQAQSADFGAYRQRLAGAVPAARAEGNARQASGKVQASVDDRNPAAAPAPDKLLLSKPNAGAGSAAEERISKERERRESEARVAELSKNVAELKDLRGATATAARAASGPADTAPAAAPVNPAASSSVLVAAPPAVTAPPAVAASPAASPVAVATTSAASAPATAAPPASAVAAAPRPPRPASAAAAPRPAEEPGFLASLVEDNELAFGVGGVLLLLLAGYGVYRVTRKPKVDSGETSFLESRLQPDSFFGASGGQRIDTREAGGASSSMSYSLSQLDAIGDVDPVAEADVYLAYGRDLQAEEILKEAMRANPERMAIRSKLLEVYAKRRDTKGFELLATQLYALTHGEGEDWAKAQELGQQIDPENPLFQPGGAPAGLPDDSGQMVEVLGASTMPQSVLPAASTFGESNGRGPAFDTAPTPSRFDVDLDLDLDTGGPHTAPSPLEATQAFAPPMSAGPSGPPSFGPSLFTNSSYAPHAAGAAERDEMSLDFALPDLPPAPPPPARPAPMPFDLESLSLDLDMPDAAPASRPAPPPSAVDSAFADSDLPAIDDGVEGDPLSRKLELADEFRQIGDTDGARDLLEEVIAKASGSVKARAEGMLKDLA